MKIVKMETVPYTKTPKSWKPTPFLYRESWQWRPFLLYQNHENRYRSGRNSPVPKLYIVHPPGTLDFRRQIPLVAVCAWFKPRSSSPRHAECALRSGESLKAQPRGWKKVEGSAWRLKKSPKERNGLARRNIPLVKRYSLFFKIYS